MAGNWRRGSCVGMAIVLLCGAVLRPARAAIGDLDETFGDRGVVTTAYGETEAQALPGGGLQLHGLERPDRRTLRVRLRRYDANGQPDGSWNGGREFVTDLVSPAVTPWEWDVAGPAVVVGAAGHSFVVAVASRTDSPGGPFTGGLFVVARLRPEGDLDTGFGRQGFAVLARDSAEVRAFPWPQSDGTLLLGIGADPANEGYGYSVPQSVRRITTGGILDGSFTSPGSLWSAYQASEYVALWQRPDGRIWVVLDAGVLRLDPDGALDRSFGTDGFLRARAAFGTLLGVSTSGPRAYLAIQEAVLTPDGRMVLALAARESRLAAGLVRLDADGSRDIGFGPGASGYVAVDVARFAWHDAPLVAAATRLRRAPDGGLALAVTVGSVDSYTEFEAIALNAPDRTLALRLSAEGLPDPRFGDGGVRLLSLAERPFLVAAQARGAALIAHDGGLRRLGADSATAPGLLSVQPYVKLPESAGTVRLPVLRSAGSRGAVRVEFATEDGMPIVTGADGAVAGSDYDATSGYIDWADGESGVKLVTLRITDDSAAEKYEYLRVRWRVLVGDATLLGRSTGAGVIEGYTTIQIDASDQSTAAAVPATGGAASGPAGSGGSTGGGGAIGVATLLAMIAALGRRRRPRRD